MQEIACLSIALLVACRPTLDLIFRLRTIWICMDWNVRLPEAVALLNDAPRRAMRGTFLVLLDVNCFVVSFFDDSI